MENAMKTWAGLLIALGLLLAAIAPAYAVGPSFDCRYAKTGLERLICRDPTLAETDLGIAQVVSAMRERFGTGEAPEIERRNVILRNEAQVDCEVPSTGIPQNSNVTLCVLFWFQRFWGNIGATLNGGAY